MPYIERAFRTIFDEGLCKVATPKRVGQLNYVFTTVIQDYLGKVPNYQRFNDAIGALEACKLELYRRMVAPYEDKKIAENGDVY